MERNQKKLGGWGSLWLFFAAFYLFSWLVLLLVGFFFFIHPPLPIHFNYVLLREVILGNSTGLSWKCPGPMGLAMTFLLCGYTLVSG